jgi:hypothetical protein
LALKNMNFFQATGSTAGEKNNARFKSCAARLLAGRC